MTARASMATLITRLRLMVGDPAVAGTPPTGVFSDDELADILDNHRSEIIEARLLPRRTLVAGTPPAANTAWLEFQARWGSWESDWSIVSADGWTSVTPSASDEIHGRWTFATSQTSQLYVSGKVYDLHGAAVDVLQAWQAKVMSEFDFTTDGQSFYRSQKGTKMAQLAAEYRRKATPMVPVIVRDAESV